MYLNDAGPGRELDDVISLRTHTMFCLPTSTDLYGVKEFLRMMSLLLIERRANALCNHTTHTGQTSTDQHEYALWKTSYFEIFPLDFVKNDWNTLQIRSTKPPFYPFSLHFFEIIIITVNLWYFIYPKIQKNKKWFWTHILRFGNFRRRLRGIDFWGTILI